MKEWEKDVAAALSESPHFKRRGGQDYIHLFMKYGQNVNQPLKDLYDKGPMVATTDRSFWSISHNLPTPFKTGHVVVLPYVSSTYVDRDPPPAGHKRGNDLYTFDPQPSTLSPQPSMQNWHLCRTGIYADKNLPPVGHK